MTLNWTSLLYDPLYNSIGVPATLGTTSVTVIDETRGVGLAGNAIIETVRPAARIRVKELAENNIDVSGLKDNSLTFNGKTWRIKSHEPVPSKGGESDGQIRLILLDEG